MLTRAPTDFLTDEQRMVRDTARDFARDELAPNAARWDREGWLPEAVLSKLGELGFLGMLVPEEWEGMGGDYLAYALAIEEIAAGCASSAVIMSVQNGLGCGSILSWGSDAQKRRWLPGLASGERIACFCLTEPQAGSEANNLKTKARLEGGRWILDGVKQFITAGKRAQIAIVFAVTDPELGKKGLSAFVVPTDTPGFQPQKLEHKLGIRASDTAAFILDDCRVPKKNLLGDAEIDTKKSFAGAMRTFDNTRPLVAAMAVGLTRASIERTTELLADAGVTVDPDVPADRQSAAAAELLAMEADYEAARLLTMEAAWMADNGKPNSLQASMAKAKAGRTCVDVALGCVELCGSLGYGESELLEKWARDAKILDIFEGTQQIQLLIVARQLLGKSSSELR